MTLGSLKGRAVGEKLGKLKLYLDYEKMSEYSEGVLCWPDVSAELLLHTWLLLIFEQARSRVRMSLCGESSASLTS